ncbi:NAD(P)H nitroreductase [Actinophytocola glycyrrhizae]|uniref:NAD(P)H nitroreductase n=1 Tax=Actinophytocola glycyrrhizae TaxID=2044873 RepID=A0ABV9SAD0_9PSEU
MNTTTTIRPGHQTVLDALRLANRAPSVHNTQPWHWLVGDYSVHLMADRARHVPADDPGARDLVLSCGAALHHLRTALAASGWHAAVCLLPGADPDHLASVEVVPREPAEQDVALALAIPRRHTDHGPFTAWPVPAGHLDLLVRHVTAEGGLLVPVTDPAHRHLGTTAIASGTGWQEETGPPAVPGGDEVLVLATRDDDAVSRLRAGAAASAALLAATGLGLATCPLSRPLRLGCTRARVRDEVLHGRAHPQLFLRVGWAGTEPRAASTRRPVTETVTYLPGTGPRREAAVRRSQVPDPRSSR